MKDQIILTAPGPLRGEITPPSDKSISHRSLILAAIADGRSIIRNILRADDPMSTLGIMRSLGVEIMDDGDTIEVSGRGIHELKEPHDILDCGNSGTTMRLLTGLLSGQPFFSVITGDDSIRKRPMKRVITPLRMMGANLYGREADTLPPIAIRGGNLKSIQYQSPVASAQVKSAILLAGLYADGETVIEEPGKSRDHSERMLSACGADIETAGLKVTLKGGSRLNPLDVIVPGDFSSAAFFMAAASTVKGSEVLIRNVGMNPTRTGMIEVMKKMGADIELAEEREISGEPAADIICRYTGGLKGIDIAPDEVPAMIDEFPVTAVLAAHAEGTTTIRGAEELRVKESDRIIAMTSELRKMGVDVEEYPDGLSIQGPAKMKGAVVQSYNDHRVAMALAVASLTATGETTIDGKSAVDISYPGFFEYLKGLTS